MVRRRAGDEISLLDSSIRTAGGAVVSTPLYVLSGVVYAVVTSPAATGTFFFVSIVAALVLRPVRGISQTLQKLGSEPDERVGAYLGLSILFAVGYLVVGGAGATLSSGVLTRRTVFTADLLAPAGMYAASLALSMIVLSLLGAIGYPSVQTWLGGAQTGVRLAAIVLLDPLVTSATELLLVSVGVRVALFAPVAVYLGVRPRLPGRRELRRAWAFAKWSIPDQVLDRFSYNMPVFVLGVVATPAAVGVYEAADRFADFGATISWRLSSPLLTKVSGDAAAGNDYATYLDGAVTGGTGVTFVVFGYLLGAHDVVARIAFAGAEAAFATTVLVVGGVNVLRGFWTLTSHAMEGLGKPSVSFRTKLYGLVFSVPVPAFLGAEYGAVAGAAGYGVMNLVVFGYVCYYARDVFGYVPLDATTAAHLTVGGVVASLLTVGVVSGGAPAGVSPTGVAALAALVCLCGFVGVLLVVSPPTRVVARRAAELSRGALHRGV
jgi:O-antigen/teichoic acid export membrane protein